MESLTSLPNIGKIVADQLLQVGITSIEDLTKLGSKKAWLRIKAIDESACYNRLCGIEGAIQNIRWHNLDVATKNDLKEFYNLHKNDR